MGKPSRFDITDRRDDSLRALQRAAAVVRYNEGAEYGKPYAEPTSHKGRHWDDVRARRTDAELEALLTWARGRVPWNQ